MSNQTSYRAYQATSRSKSARRRLRRRRHPRRCRRRRRRGVARRRSAKETGVPRTSNPNGWSVECTFSPTVRKIGVICCCLSRSPEKLSRKSGNRLVGLLLLILLRQAVHQLCHLASFRKRVRREATASCHVHVEAAPTEMDRAPEGGRSESQSRRGFDRVLSIRFVRSSFSYGRKYRGDVCSNIGSTILLFYDL